MALYRRILLDGPPCPDDGPLKKPCSKDDKGDKGDGQRLKVIIIAIAIIVSVFFFCLIYYYAVLRRRRSRRHPLLPTAAVPAGDGAASPPSDDDGPSEDGEGLHHVWYIRTAGLDEATIDSIAIVEYKAGGRLLGATDCSVCLGEFEDGDLVRLLPKCGHGFHVPCIDTWLRAHVNCPVCRAHIIDPPVEIAGAAPPHPPAATTAGTISVDDLSSSAPVDNPETGIQALENDIGVQDMEEEIRGMESGTGIGILMDRLPESSELRVPSDLGQDGLQPVRRSVSMDSPFLGILPIGEELEENSVEEGKDINFGEEQRSKNRRKQGISSKRVSLKKSDSAIERSLSSSGWVFSRYGRVAKNSIPPCDGG